MPTTVLRLIAVYGFMAVSVVFGMSLERSPMHWLTILYGLLILPAPAGIFVLSWIWSLVASMGTGWLEDVLRRIIEQREKQDEQPTPEPDPEPTPNA